MSVLVYIIGEFEAQALDSKNCLCMFVHIYQGTSVCYLWLQMYNVIISQASVNQ
jgi:hypothetical protein